MSMRPRMESAVSAYLIVLVIRSRRPSFKSKPGKYLLLATLVIVVVTLFLPISPLAGLLEFQPLPVSLSPHAVRNLAQLYYRGGIVEEGVLR